MRGIVLPILVFICLTSCELCSAQTVDAQIEGIVTDSDGAAVAGARVTALNTDNGSVLNAATNDSGIYQFPVVTLGRYTLTVECTGFKKAVRSGIQLKSP